MHDLNWPNFIPQEKQIQYLWRQTSLKCQIEKPSRKNMWDVGFARGLSYYLLEDFRCDSFWDVGPLNIFSNASQCTLEDSKRDSIEIYANNSLSCSTTEYSFHF